MSKEIKAEKPAETEIVAAVVVAPAEVVAPPEAPKTEKPAVKKGPSPLDYFNSPAGQALVAKGNSVRTIMQKCFAASGSTITAQQVSKFLQKHRDALKKGDVAKLLKAWC